MCYERRSVVYAFYKIIEKTFAFVVSTISAQMYTQLTIETVSITEESITEVDN